MGLQDFGTITIDMIRNQDDLGQLELEDAKANQDQRTMIITLPSSTNNVLTFECFVTALTMDINADGVVTGTATIRITGGIVYS